MITGAKRLGFVWGNESFNAIDVYPQLSMSETCLALQVADNGFGDMFKVLTSGRFLEGRINKFYFDALLKSTCVDYAYPNKFPEYWRERFSVSQVTFGTYEFLYSNLDEEDNINNDIYYFISDNCTGIIVGMNNETMRFLLGIEPDITTPHYIQNMTNGFNKTFTTFFDPNGNAENNCQVFNEKRPVRGSTVITTDEGEDYYVTYYDSRGLVKYLYWAVYKSSHLSETKWEVDKTVLHFTYSSQNRTSSDTLCLTNTGAKDIDWILNTESTVGITIDKTSGTIKSKQKQCLVASIDVQKRMEVDINSVAYYLAITPIIDLSTCYSSFVLTAEYDVKDCTANDVNAYIAGSKNFDLIIKYKWKEPHTCYDGIELPHEYKHKGRIYIYIYCILFYFKNRFVI